VLKAWFDGEPATRSALVEIAEVARLAAQALEARDLDRALALVVREGGIRRRMAPGVSTPGIESLDRAAREAGAVGTKILGAGGGGSVLVVGPDPFPPAVDAALARGPWQVLPLTLSETGLRVECRPSTTSP
jgi:D-glycero-alpha-D-manno-heptose-7-phosphate kinase